jgi:hypothetical protein
LESDHKAREYCQVPEGKKFDDLIPELISGIKTKHPAHPLRYDTNFIQICKDIGYSPKYQYQLLQSILQVPAEGNKRDEYIEETE